MSKVNFVSVSAIQRQYELGYTKAARLQDDVYEYLDEVWWKASTALQSAVPLEAKMALLQEIKDLCYRPKTPTQGR